MELSSSPELMSCTERPEWLVVSAEGLVMPGVTITPGMTMLSSDVTCGLGSGPGIGNVIVITVMASYHITYISLQPLCLPMMDRVNGRKMFIIVNIFFVIKDRVLNVKHIDCVKSNI